MREAADALDSSAEKLRVASAERYGAHVLAVMLVVSGCAPAATSTDDASAARDMGLDTAGAQDAGSTADAGPGWQALCDELAASLDRRATDCGCSVTHAGCFGDARVEAAVAGSVARGEIHYDEAALRDVVTRAEAATGCGHLYELLGWTFSDYTTFGGAFTGTLAPRDLCGVIGVYPSPCANGVCVPNPGGIRPQVCQVFTDVGSACTLDFCVDLDQPAHPQTFPPSPIPCDFGGPCASPVAGTGADGTPCGFGSECATGACLGGRGGGTCGPPAPNGTPCDFPSDCASSACVVTGSAAACAPGICVL